MFDFDLNFILENHIHTIREIPDFNFKCEFHHKKMKFCYKMNMKREIQND